MASKRRDPLPRLSIAPNLNMQQPMGGPGQLYSPALPTSLQQSFHPSFPLSNNPLQTPMQSFFTNTPPGAPGRPVHGHAHHASIQLAAAGIHPPPSYMTPVAAHFPRLTPNGQPLQHPLPGHKRRQLSIGGPPKAVLGGPARKVSPLPAATGTTPTPAPVAAPTKPKKVVVNLPKETVVGDGGEKTRREWARTPLPVQDGDSTVALFGPPVLITAESYPPDDHRLGLPNTIDVYLPGKIAWEAIKQQNIEEKLEKLGVEKGSGSNTMVPQIHARAASISSPADPALLLFKLNKLQQAQDGRSAGNSLSVSPQPAFTNPFGLSPSPSHQMRFMTNRHGHTMSLAQPTSASYQNSLFSNSPSPYNPSPFNPFGHTALPESVAESILSEGSVGSGPNDPMDIHAPQGRIPFTIPTFSSSSLSSSPVPPSFLPSSLSTPLGVSGQPPLSAVGGNKSHVDFIRGFGLDVPLESEEENEVEEEQGNGGEADDEGDNVEDKGEDTDGADDASVDLDDGTSTIPPHSRLHSRHVSSLSAALSLRSVGGGNGSFGVHFDENGDNRAEMQYELSQTLKAEGGDIEYVDEEEEDKENQPPPMIGLSSPAPLNDPAIDEWTGSEDVNLGLEEDSEDESIGEWSNPSDEERARQQRVERRMRRRNAQLEQQLIDQPRRLPNFPQPPAENPLTLRAHNEDNDDIISNPSEEENYARASIGSVNGRGRQAEFVGMSTEEYHPHPHSLTSSFVGMPQALHSRGPSGGQYSAHDPAMAHSRTGSENMDFPQPSYGHHQPQTSGSSVGRRGDSLNPFAKPFVFGVPRASTAATIRGASGSWQSPSSFSSHQVQVQALVSPSTSNHSAPGSATTSTHSRLPSIGKPLNVAAPEFRPAFSFRLPDAPQMPVPEPSILMPTPVPSMPQPQGHSHGQQLETIHSVESTPFKVQGREKRPRLGSSGSIEEGDSMASFKFPIPMRSESSPPSNIRGQHGHRSSLSGGNDEGRLNPTARPFTFAGFSEVANNMPKMGAPGPDEGEDEEEEGNKDFVLENLIETSTAKADEDSSHEIEVQVTKPKRAPIPLDFKHPVSSNTVPAGLFKALINSSDDRTRRTVRSRLSSRDYFEHSRRPSMDDENVQTIARRSSMHRLVTDPGQRRSPGQDDVFKSVRHTRRRSSLPDALENRDMKASSSSLDLSMSPRDLTMRMEIHHIEDVIAGLLEDKFAELRRQLRPLASVAVTPITTDLQVSSTTETMMADLISLFRAQLQESATRSLEDSQMDARGELDFQMVKDMLEESQKELVEVLQREVKSLPISSSSPITTFSSGAQEIVPIVEQVGNKTISAVMEAISELSARQEAALLNTPAHEQDIIVDKLVNTLSPMIESLHNAPIDYDFLTRELAQAVKPHITQLIDLASDKRETAGLIVDKILPAIKNITIDADSITMHLITEVRKAIAPIDAFEIKEQVADLVVERLDSRLAVRDRTFNVETVTARVTESVSKFFDLLKSVPPTLENVAGIQASIKEAQSTVAETQERIFKSVEDVPNKVNSQIEAMKSIQNDILHRIEHPSIFPHEPDVHVLEVKSVTESLASEQKKLAEQLHSLLSNNRIVVDKLDVLPGSLSAMITGLQSAMTELVNAQNTSKREIEDLRKSNSEYQLQVVKARGSHGQARVEKDLLNEKLSTVESERDKLRIQIQELQALNFAKEKEVGALAARNTELEEALAKALARLQSADVTADTNQRSISALEKANKDLILEKEELKANATALQLDVEYGRREREALAKSYDMLQQHSAQLVSQQSNWDALHAASEKIGMVYNLLENADSEEQKELRVYRDRSQALEDENAELQSRLHDLESKFAASERNAGTIRQTLSQAQQRSTEWERRAKESEGQLEMVRTKLDQSEQTHSQLESDYQLVNMQLEEQEADNRVRQDREDKLREQISALENKCSVLQKELEKVNLARMNSKSPTPLRPTTNGNTHSLSRPDSRANTVYDGRGSTRPMSSYTSSHSMASNVATETSVYDSIHAPSNIQNQNKWNPPTVHTPVGRYSTLAPPTPKPHRPAHNHYARAPSPTASIVSAAPTQGDDGWWS